MWPRVRETEIGTALMCHLVREKRYLHFYLFIYCFYLGQGGLALVKEKILNRRYGTLILRSENK